MLPLFKFMRIKLPDHVNISHFVKRQRRCHLKVGKSVPTTSTEVEVPEADIALAEDFSSLI
jgi:hypothetical protein